MNPMAAWIACADVVKRVGAEYGVTMTAQVIKLRCWWIRARVAVAARAKE
jgi:hypothetical protein